MARSHNVGFRVFKKIPRPSRQVVEELGKFETTLLSDAMNRFGSLDLNIRGADPSMRVAGPAVTVRARPGDNLMVYAAFAVAQPGDVLLIESRGYTTQAQWGDMLSRNAKGLNLGGCVTDGAVRDVPGLREVGFPVFGQSVLTPTGGFRDGPGEVNVPVSVGGVPILPGDIVVGDVMGVVVIPRQDAEAVLAKARDLLQNEAKRVKDLDDGKLIPAWLQSTLEQKGCEFSDDLSIDAGDGWPGTPDG